MILHVSHGHDLDAADVDAILQEVRVRLWQSQASPETIRGLGASYVYRTATSAAVDILRRRRAARTGVEAVSDVSESMAGGERGPVGELEGQELEQQVFAAVGRLPDDRRAVVRMYLAGYGRQEIADALHWSETRVRNLLHRGLVELRSLLVQQGIGPEAAAE
jgi:RNA polymerase sigma-70 factor (ECF subfamily)